MSDPDSVSNSSCACFSMRHSWQRVLAGLCGSCDEKMLEMSSVTSEGCRYVVYIVGKTKSHEKQNRSCATASINVVKALLFSTVCQIQTLCMREKEYYGGALVGKHQTFKLCIERNENLGQVLNLNVKFSGSFSKGSFYLKNNTLALLSCSPWPRSSLRRLQRGRKIHFPQCSAGDW